MIRRPPRSTLFPYTTLFRSHDVPGLQMPRDTSSLAASLGTRQKEILGLVGEGLSNAQIAERLFLSESPIRQQDRKSTRLNSSHANISYAVFCLKKKKPPCSP